MQPFLKPVPTTGLHASALPDELTLWLERALGVSGARPAAVPGEWRDAATEARDAVLRALAQRFYPCVPVSTQAARIYALSETYAFVNWPRDRERTQVPARFRDTTDEYLWAAFKSGAPMPLGTRELRRILIGSCENDG